MLEKVKLLSGLFAKVIASSIVYFFIMGIVFSTGVIILELIIGSLSFIFVGSFKGLLSHIQTTNNFLIEKDIGFVLSEETWKLETSSTILNSLVNWLINLQFSFMGNVRLFIFSVLGLVLMLYLSMSQKFDFDSVGPIADKFAAIFTLLGFILYAPLAYGIIMTIFRLMYPLIV